MTTTHNAYSSTQAVAKFNAWFFDAFDGLIDWSLRRVKRRVFVDIPSTVVEIGAGVGANFRYYKPGTRVIAIEPNTEMHERLAANAERAGIELDIRSTTAEDTGLEAESVDAVVSSLVLCTVLDPIAAAREAHRILVPGGRFLLVEHVRSHGPLRLVQKVVARPWKWLFEGCDLGRDTVHDLASAGFRTNGLTSRTIATVFVPVNSLLFGEVVK